MSALRVEIARFVEEHQPGFVECTLFDAEGRRHSFIEKAPVVSHENLRPTSAYPRPGTIACRVREEWNDGRGRALLRLSTDEPWHVTSTTGLSEFVVLASEVAR